MNKNLMNSPFTLACDDRMKPETVGLPMIALIRKMASDILSELLAERPTEPVVKALDSLAIEGFFLGPGAAMVCVYLAGDAESRYRSYGNALERHTAKRLKLVAEAEFVQYLPAVRPVLESPLSSPEEVRNLRTQFSQVLLGSFSSRDSVWRQLVLSELATNTAMYGKGGRMRIFRDRSAIWLLAEDDGPGLVPLHSLPLSLLRRGFSSSSGRSLGVGYPLIIDLSKRVVLTSNSKGTRCLVELETPKTNEVSIPWK